MRQRGCPIVWVRQEFEPDLSDAFQEMRTKDIRIVRGFVLILDEFRPEDWDNPLPSDVALTLPGDSEPTIVLSAQSEVAQARFDRPSPVATSIFCDKLKKAHEHLSSRGVLAGPIQDRGDMRFFEIRDPEGHLIEICKEP